VNYGENVTLLDAFRQLRPDDHVAVDNARSQAAEMLFKELNLLAAKVKVDPDLCRDDAVQVVIARLLRGSKRGPRYGDPDSDDGVRSYLLVALRNAVEDQRRARGPVVDPPPNRDDEGKNEEWPPPEPGKGSNRKDLEGEIDKQRRKDKTSSFAATRQVLDDGLKPLHKLVSEVAGQMRRDAAKNFIDTFNELKAIAFGDKDFGDLVEAEALHGEDQVVVKGRFYQRYSRAFRRIEEALRDSLADGRIHSEEAEIVRRGVDWLRLE
jgi:hypothetical protein